MGKTYYHLYYRDAETGKPVSLKCSHIEDSSLGLGFVKVSGFIFDTQGLVVQPGEEQMRKKLAHVKSMHLSIYSILSIEERGRQHRGLQFKKDRSNLIALPTVDKK